MKVDTHKSVGVYLHFTGAVFPRSLEFYYLFGNQTYYKHLFTARRSPTLLQRSTIIFDRIMAHLFKILLVFHSPL